MSTLQTSSLWFWAKLRSATWPEKYHPVICHLIDVGQVARRLWSDVCRAKVREWVTGRLGLPDQDAAGAWLAFWAAAHDIGKVSPDFQSQGKTAELKKRLAPEFNFGSPGGKKHGDVSTAVLAAELTAKGRDWPSLDGAVARAVAVAVGGHHGLFPTEWHGMRGPLGNERWAAARRELLTELARRFGAPGRPAPCLPPGDDQSVWMFVAGLTSVADWIGSNVEFFQPVGNPALVDGPFDVGRYFDGADKKAAVALETLGWLGRANDRRPVLIEDFLPRGRTPRPLQTTVAEIVAGMTSPRLLIVEAPMGEGKTEAGWFAAACWDERDGQGAYVALPTMATSNQMFDRVGLFLEEGSGKKNLMLLHGKAALNKRFEQLKYEAQMYDDGTKPSAVVAEAWFAANKKHRLLAPYGVGTIDQALLAVLQTRHVFVRLFGLAGKCVILDEVHAYDTYMTTLMERLLRWLAALGCPVVLLSATLPRDKRLKLLRAYGGDELPEPKAVPYPRVTSVAVGGPAESVPVQADPERAKTVRLGWLEEGRLAEHLRTALADGGCAAVIRNTVGLAQETYLELRDALKGEGIEVELFHARFPFGRRMEIEDAVLKRFGKEGGPAERNKRVLVATQVVEQSLDLDFDVMVSDVAPVDLVLQRAGRLHRHDRGPRPAGVAEPRVWLIEPQTDDDGVPDFGVSGVVYARYVLFRSLLTLREKSGELRTTIELPAEINGLIQAVYDDADPPARLTGAQRAFWERSRADHTAAVSKEEDEAESRRIRKPKHTGRLARLVGVPREEDNPDLHPAHQALTRLSRPTAQLICLETGGPGAFRLIHDQSPIRTLAVRKVSAGGAEDIGQLLLGELTTAHPGVVRELWGSPRRPSAWAEVGMLCHHHQIAFVNGRALVGEYELLVDNELGLQVIRDGGEDE